MPPHQTPSADAHPDPAPKRPRPAQPVAHLMRQHVARSGQRPEEIDWAAFAGQTGLPLSEVLSIASFHEEFSGSARAMPPEFGPEAPCLATDARLTAKEDTTDLLRFVEALRRSATPAESIWNRLRHLEGWNEHRSKSRRTIWGRWQDAVTTPAPRRFLICHAEAGNHGADGSRWLLRHRPTKVLSGIALAATAVGATDCVICVDRSQPELLQDLEKTIAQLTQEGAWSDGIEISVMPTFGSHVGGEETALLNVIEGRRGEVRLRPPEPEVAGVFGLPTLMETAETFALLPDWLRYGRDDGHRLATLRLSDERTGMVEIDSRVTLRDLIDGFAEPVDLAAPAWLFGGPFGSLVFEDHLDLPLYASTLREERIHPGNWSIEPIRPGTSFNEFAEPLLAFAATESCGKCAPCRLGPLAARRLATETGIKPHRLIEILDTVSQTSLCGFGRHFPGPILNWLSRWGTAAAPVSATLEASHA